jgi:hypothetical protein
VRSAWAGLRRAVQRAALAFLFALVGSFLLGCATLAVAFLAMPSVATVAGHMAAMFSFPVWFLGAVFLGGKRPKEGETAKGRAG